MTNRRMIAATMAPAAWAASPRFRAGRRTGGRQAPPRAQPQTSREEREKQFQESLDGVELNGHFTMNGQESPKKEKYTILGVKKLNDTVWIFNARIQYGDKDVTVPVPMKVEWAGDTPVASMTDMPVPGLGMFTARVVFFLNRYAGTWQHGDEAGGHLFGTFAKAAAKAD